MKYNNNNEKKKYYYDISRRGGGGMLKFIIIFCCVVVIVVVIKPLSSIRRIHSIGASRRKIEFSIVVSFYFFYDYFNYTTL